MRSLHTHLIVCVTFCVSSFNSATAQEIEGVGKTITVGSSVKIVVVELDALSVEYEGKVDANDNGSLVIEDAKKTLVINRRVPYLCYLPYVGDYFRSVVRRPLSGTQSVRISLNE
jgi:hypothetical protein